MEFNFIENFTEFHTVDPMNSARDPLSERETPYTIQTHT